MNELRSPSALRIDLRAGEWILWRDRIHRIERLYGERVRIRDASTGELHEVPIAEVRGIESLPAGETDRRLERQRTVDPGDWLIAREREAVIAQLLQGGGTLAARVAQGARALGISARTVRRLMQRYATSAQTSSLLPQRRGPHRLGRRLGSERERLINEAIERRYLVRPRTPMEEVYREVVQRCGTRDWLSLRERR